MTKLEKAWANICAKIACVPEFPTNDLYSVADALHKFQKYSWHDLRKDPEDLPKEQLHQVLVKIEGSWNKHVKYDCGWIFDGSWFHVDGKVIAWREIDPFEE